MTTQLNWGLLCQFVNAATAQQCYPPTGEIPIGSQLSITAASAWNPVAASGNAVVDLYIVPNGGTEADATHVDRVSVPPGSALPLTNAINQKLTAGYALFASTNGATLTMSGSVAS